MRSSPPDATSPQKDPNFMLSLARGLAMIRAFEVRYPLTIAELARRTNLSRAAARRCLHTLMKLGYAASRHGRYGLTPSVLALGHAYFRSVALPRLAQPILDRLSETVGEACSVAVLDGDEVVTIACSGTRHVRSISQAIGQRSPAYRTSTGRVLLAYADPTEVRARWGALVRDTAHSLESEDAVWASLHTVRTRGFALLDQGSESEVTALAVPILRPDGSAAAAMDLVLRVPAAGRERLMTTHKPRLQAAASKLAAALASGR